MCSKLGGERVFIPGALNPDPIFLFDLMELEVSRNNTVPTSLGSVKINHKVHRHLCLSDH